MNHFYNQTNLSKQIEIKKKTNKSFKHMEITTKKTVEIVFKYSIGQDKKEKAANLIISHQNYFEFM